MASPIDDVITDNEDDAVQKSAGATSISTTELSFGPYKGYRHCGLRFRTDIDDLSSGDITITSATLKFRATQSDSGGFSGTLFIEDDATPGVYTTGNNDLTDRPVIGVGIPITGVLLGNTTSGQDFTLDIKELMQQLVDDGTIASSQISFLYIHSSGNGQRVFQSLENAGSNPVEFDVAYTSSGNATFAAKEAKNVTITNPSSAITADADFEAKEAITILTIGAIAPSAEITATNDETIQAKAAITVPITGAVAPNAVITADADFTAVEAITVFNRVTAPNADIFAGDAGVGDFGNIERTIDISEYEAGIVFYLEVTMNTNNALLPAKAHLYNVTDSIEVVGSEVTTTSTSATTVRSNLFGLAGSKVYKVRLGGLVGATYSMSSADLLIDWTR